MIKFLINFGTFLLCAAIVAFAGVKTVQENNIQEMVDRIEDIMTVDPEPPIEPESPDVPTDPDKGDEVKPAPTPDKPDEPTIPDNPTVPDEPTSAEKTENALKDLYDNHNSALSDAKKETVSSTISSSIDTSTEDGELISDIVNSYVDNLFAQIDSNKEQNSGATEEESNAARDEFAKKESEAISGLVDIMNTSTEGERPSDEQISSSVESVLESEVCLGTVTAITEDEEMTERIQEATSDMDTSAKDQIQSTIQSKLDETRESGTLTEEELREKEDQYQAIADLFGIKLN